MNIAGYIATHSDREHRYRYAAMQQDAVQYMSREMEILRLKIIITITLAVLDTESETDILNVILS